MSSKGKLCCFRVIFDKAFIVMQNAKAYKFKIIPCEIIRQLHEQQLGFLQAEMNVAIKQVLKTEQCRLKLQTIETSNLIASIERIPWRKKKYENIHSGVYNAVCCFIIMVDIRPKSDMMSQNTAVKENSFHTTDAINTSDCQQDSNEAKPDANEQNTEINLQETPTGNFTADDVKGGINGLDNVMPLADEISADQKQNETAVMKIVNISEDVLERHVDENNTKRCKKLSRKIEDPFLFSKVYSKLCKRQKLSHAMNVIRCVKIEETRLQMLSAPIVCPLPFDLM